MPLNNKVVGGGELQSRNMQIAAESHEEEVRDQEDEDRDREYREDLEHEVNVRVDLREYYFPEGMSTDETTLEAQESLLLGKRKIVESLAKSIEPADLEGMAIEFSHESAFPKEGSEKIKAMNGELARLFSLAHAQATGKLVEFNNVEI